MGYFVIIVFTTFLGSPPEFIPVAFKNNSDCLNYLTKEVVKQYKYMQISSNGNGKFLKNSKQTQFLICKEFDKEKLYSWE